MSSFRPLPGDLISQLDENVSLYTVNIAFPSPSRGSYFSIMILIPDSGKPQRFRPLPGDLISQSYRCRRTAWSYFVSVPFTGILFLNNKHYIATWNNRKSFRPLPGDLISQFFAEKRSNILMAVVSVPFPGILFLNLSFTCLILTGFQSRIAVQNQIRLWNKLLSP